MLGGVQGIPGCLRDVIIKIRAEIKQFFINVVVERMSTCKSVLIAVCYRGLSTTKPKRNEMHNKSIHLFSIGVHLPVTDEQYLSFEVHEVLFSFYVSLYFYFSTFQREVL